LAVKSSPKTLVYGAQEILMLRLITPIAV